MSGYNHNLSTLAFHNVKNKIKANFGFALFSWQTNTSIDFIYQEKDVFVIVGINIENCLIYQAISEITRRNVLVISFTIALIEDQ